MEKEYIVTLKKGIEPVAFRQDMVASNMLPYVPNRSATVANERPASTRNTHYMLTDQEAVELEKDSRVDAVELRPDLRDDVGIERVAIQEGDFNKTTSSSGANINWGLRRMSALSNPYNTSGVVVGGYTHTLTGTGVDFIVQDSGIQADHPEFQDSFGNSRVQQIDWYQAQPTVAGTLPDGFYTDYDGHGTHCAGIAAGKTYGWAKNSKVYSIKIAGLQGTSDPNSGMPMSDIFDVIKEWHLRKKDSNYTPTNATYTPSEGIMTMTIGLHSFVVGDKIRIAPYGITFRCAKDNFETTHSYPRGEGVPNETGTDPFYEKEIAITAVSSDTITVNIGISSDTTVHRFDSASINAIIVPGVTRKRPTVVNMSWGYFSRYLYINGGSYRGTPWSGNTKVNGYGMTGAFDGVGYRHPTRIASVDADVEELIEAGVTVCIAAGNGYHKIATATDVDYNNYYTTTFGQTKYYHRGSSPFSSNAIMVGNVDSTLDSEGNEQVAQSSEKGPGVDVYAPGTNIVSATSNTNKFTDGPYGDTAFRITNISGTSMAAPQIAGLVATYGEIQPKATPAQQKEWVVSNAKEQLNDNGNAGNDYTNYRSLMGGQNAYAFQTYNDSNVLTIAGDETIVADAGAIEATYAITASASSVSEGDSFTVTLTTTGLVNGTIIPYTITGVSSSDINGAPLLGTFIVGTNQILTVTVTEDNVFDDGVETFTITLNDFPNRFANVNIIDSSKPDPAYSLTTSRDSLGEGESVIITLVASNVLSGTLIPYVITGVDSADITDAPLTGNFTVGSDMQRTYVITADGALEGSETLVFEASGETVSVQINDTSNTPITYALVASADTVDEGDSFDIDLNVENGIPGVEIAYLVTGISATDLSAGALSGTYVTGSVTRASFTVSSDFTTEGTETFTISLTTIDDVSTTVTINDTSTTLVAGSEVVTTIGNGAFTIPTDVTSVSIMAVGGGAGSGTTAALGAGQITGGGGAGAMGIVNNLAVTPGQVIAYTVGAGGSGNNNGGDTSVTYGGTTYTAGGGQASPAVSITSLNPAAFQRKLGGAGGTTTGAWNISKAGGAGGDSMRFNTGKAVVGGGGGGAGAGSVGGTGYPFNDILDPQTNGKTSPYNWTQTALATVSAVDVSYSGAILATFDMYAGSYGEEHAYIVRHKLNQVLANSTTWVDGDNNDYDSYYCLIRNEAEEPVQVYKSLTKNFGPSVPTTTFGGAVGANNVRYTFGSVNDSVAIETTTTFNGTTFIRGNSYSGGADATIIEFRGGVGTDATDLNTVQLATVKLWPEGNKGLLPSQTAGTGGGHGYVENWQSGTGITYGATGGGSTLTKAQTGLRGGLSSATPGTLTISGAGEVKTGVAGEKGNNVDTVTPSQTNYEVGAGAGGVLVMGLTTSGSQTRAESGQDGGIWIMYPGIRDKFEAPQYTLASNKDTANEGSTVTVSVDNNLNTTDPQIPIPYEITGITSTDINMAGLVTTYGNIRGSFTQVANSKTFTILADDTFDGAETMNLKLIEDLTATTQVNNDYYLPYMTDDAQSYNITINDTSDGTQETLAGAVTNSGASGYTWTTGSDRNGLISGLNPFVVYDRGDTISWQINAVGHPFYIKDIQGNGTANQTNGVTNQGTVNAIVSYTPTTGGRKYYQCSIHNDMNGEIYLSDKHWVTSHYGPSATRTDGTTFQFVAHAGSGSSIVIEQLTSGSNTTCAMIKYTDRGSPIWRRSFTQNYLVNTALVDSAQNIFVGYSGSWNWQTNTPSADYPSDAYITKLNASGTAQWQRSYSDGDGNGLAIKAMAFTSDGNILAVGANYLQNFDSGIWMLKIDVTNGDVLVVRKSNPTSKKGEAQDVVVDGSGNIYVYGTEIKSDGTELVCMLRKFNSELTEQWSRGFYVPSATGTGFNPAGVTVDQLDNPLIGLGHVDTPQSAFEQSHVLKINPTTGEVSKDWVINDVGVRDVTTDYRQTKPKLRDIDFDTRNNKIIAVGEQNLDNNNSIARGMIISYDDSLGSVKVRNLHTNSSSNLNTTIYKCSLDNTLNPNNRLWVSGNTISSTQTSLGRIGGMIASVPINESDTGSGTLTIEDWAYQVHGTISQDTDSPIATHNIGIAVDDTTATAGGLVNGTTSTSVTAFVEYKMVLDIGVQEEEEAEDPTYSLTSSGSSIDEGQSFTITLDTQNVANGTNVPYTISGVSENDLGGVSLTGNFTVQSNSAQVTFNVAEDTAIESAETFTITLNGIGTTTSVTINDTTSAPPAFVPDYTLTVGFPGSGLYSISGSDRSGSVSGNNINLAFNVGDKVRFNNGVSGNHPLYIKTLQGTGTGYGASGVDGQGQSTVDWTIGSTGTFYYQCTIHGAMHGDIVVSSGGGGGGY